MKKTPYYLIPVLVCFLLGFIAGRIQSDAIENWYPLLPKPALTPPHTVLPPGWRDVQLRPTSFQLRMARRLFLFP